MLPSEELALMALGFRRVYFSELHCKNTGGGEPLARITCCALGEALSARVSRVYASIPPGIVRTYRSGTLQPDRAARSAIRHAAGKDAPAA